MVSLVASSSLALEQSSDQLFFLRELTGAALSDVSALPTALDAITSAILEENGQGLILAVAAGCAEVCASMK